MNERTLDLALSGRNAALILAVGVAIASVGSSSPAKANGSEDRGRESQSSAPSALGGRWRVLGPLPQRGLQNLQALPVRGQVVVVAGATFAQERVKVITYNLRSRRWTSIRPAPLSWRIGYSAVATGRDVIVWGGTAGTAFRDGAALDPVAGEWRTIGRSPLSPRTRQSAVWTGRRMIVWGGFDSFESGTEFRDGATYDPKTDSWKLIAKAPIAGRYGHGAIWTGREMIIVGGSDESEVDGRGKPVAALRTAAAYDPDRDRWRLLPRTPTRFALGQAAAWTGKELVVWDGSVGAVYNARRDRWRALPLAPVRERREFAFAWSGAKLYVWGGRPVTCGHCALADGAAYDPRTNRWARLPTGPLRGRARPAATWSGRGLFLWGGCCTGLEPFSDGAIFVPVTAR